MRKLPKSVSEKDALLLWLALFNANTEEDLKKIEAMEVPEMNQAINAYYAITASPEFREVERLREKARHDEAQALYHARVEAKREGRQEGKIEIVRNALQMKMPVADIAKLTGLTFDEIEKLR